MKQRYVIGIDPGKTTGFALFDRKYKKITCVDSDTFWEIWYWIISQYKGDYLIVVEKPDTKAVWHRGASSRGAIERTAVNVGSVIREAELWVEGLRRLGFEVETAHPAGKKNAKMVRDITGWPRRTNSHERDAMILCWGR